MPKQKVFSVVGARPQFVKTAIVCDALKRFGEVDHRVVHTGQHFDLNMSDVFFKELGIPSPAFNLGVIASHHGAMTGRMLELLEKLYIEESPDIVVVYGDTNSTLAGALAAAKLHIPLAHVEAGLRSFNRMPEEINRVLTDHVTDIHFSVTDTSTRNLFREGIDGPHVHQVGDVMYDCAIRSVEIAERHSKIIEWLDISRGKFALCTVHRAVNTDSEDKLAALIEALDIVSREIPVVLPIHPRTRKRVQQWAIVPKSSGTLLIDPVGYLDMVALERHAAVVITDSGGVQREAFFHRRPCVTFREETEWVELVELGWNTLATVDDPEMLAATILEKAGTRGQEASPYGNGDAGHKIAEILCRVQPSDFKR